MTVRDLQANLKVNIDGSALGGLNQVRNELKEIDTLTRGLKRELKLRVSIDEAYLESRIRAVVQRAGANVNIPINENPRPVSSRPESGARPQPATRPDTSALKNYREELALARSQSAQLVQQQNNLKASLQAEGKSIAQINQELRQNAQLSQTARTANETLIRSENSLNQALQNNIITQSQYQRGLTDISNNRNILQARSNTQLREPVVRPAREPRPDTSAWVAYRQELALGRAEALQYGRQRDALRATLTQEGHSLEQVNTMLRANTALNQTAQSSTATLARAETNLNQALQAGAISQAQYRRGLIDVSNSTQLLQNRMNDATPMRSMQVGFSQLNSVISQFSPQLGMALSQFQSLSSLAQALPNFSLLRNTGISSAGASTAEGAVAGTAGAGLASGSSALAGVTSLINPVTAGLALVGGAFINAGMEAKRTIPIYAELESKLNLLAALNPNLNTEGLENARNQIQAISLELGKFNTTQISDAIIELTKAGVPIEEAYGLIRTSGKAAIATGEDFNAVTSTLLTTMKSYGIDLSESAKITDVMANVANATKADLTGLGEALSKSGASASAMKQPFTEAVAVVGLLQDRGVQAETAGRAYGSMLSRLSGSSRISETAMKKLGLTFKGPTGDAKNLSVVLEELAGKLKGVNNVDRSKVLSKIFGGEFKNQAVILIDQIEKLKELRAEAEKAGGSLEEMFKKTQKGIESGRQRLKNTTTIADQKTGQGIALNANEEGGIRGTADVTEKFIQNGTFDRIGQQVGGLLAPFNALKPVLVETGILFKDFFAQIGGLIAPVIVFLVGFGKAALEAFNFLLQGILTITAPFTNFLSIVATKPKEAVTQLANSFKQGWEFVVNIFKVALGMILITMGQGLGSITAGVGQFAKGFIAFFFHPLDTVGKLWAKFFPAVSQMIGAGLSGWLNGFMQFGSGVIESIKGAFKGIGKAFGDLFNAIKSGDVSQLKAAFDSFESKLPKEFSLKPRKINLSATVPAFKLGNLEAMANSAIDKAVNMGQGLSAKLISAGQGLQSSGKSKLPEFKLSNNKKDDSSSPSAGGDTKDLDLGSGKGGSGGSRKRGAKGKKGPSQESLDRKADAEKARQEKIRESEELAKLAQKELQDTIALTEQKKVLREQEQAIFETKRALAGKDNELDKANQDLDLEKQRIELLSKQGLISEEEKNKRLNSIENQKVLNDYEKELNKIKISNLEIQKEENDLADLKLSLKNEEAAAIDKLLNAQSELANQDNLIANASGQAERERLEAKKNELIKVVADLQKALVDLQAGASEKIQEANNKITTKKDAVTQEKTQAENKKSTGLASNENDLKAKEFERTKKQTDDIKKSLVDGAKSIYGEITSAFEDGKITVEEAFKIGETIFSKVSDVFKAFNGGKEGGSGGFNPLALLTGFKGGAGGGSLPAGQQIEKIGNGNFGLFDESGKFIKDLGTSCGIAAKKAAGMGDSAGSAGGALGGLVSGFGSVVSNLGSAVGGLFSGKGFGGFKDIFSGLTGGGKGGGEGGNPLSGILGGLGGAGGAGPAGAITAGLSTAFSIGTTIFGFFKGQKAKKKAKRDAEIKKQIEKITQEYETLMKAQEEALDKVDNSWNKETVIGISKQIRERQRILATLEPQVRAMQKQLLNLGTDESHIAAKDIGEKYKEFSKGLSKDLKKLLFDLGKQFSEFDTRVFFAGFDNEKLYGKFGKEFKGLGEAVDKAINEAADLMEGGFNTNGMQTILNDSLKSISDEYFKPLDDAILTATQDREALFKDLAKQAQEDLKNLTQNLSNVLQEFGFTKTQSADEKLKALIKTFNEERLRKQEENVKAQLEADKKLQEALDKKNSAQSVYNASFNRANDLGLQRTAVGSEAFYTQIGTQNLIMEDTVNNLADKFKTAVQTGVKENLDYLAKKIV